MSFSDWWQLLAGIAIFIFAMNLLEDSLKHLAGRPFKKFLQNQTNHKLRAIAGGTIVTAVLQSSSVVLLMVLSFVGAGIMNMRNALAVTLGANLGTTLDSWIVATLGFKVELDAISYPVLAISLLIRVLFPANIQIKHLTHFLIGFSLLFIGLEWMKVSVHGLVEGVDMTRYAEWSPYLFIPIGLILTAIIQSSSATIAITLTALYHGVIPFPSAAGIVIGSEMGTTLKILLSSYGGIPDKKRVAMGNFIFNVILAILASIFLYPLIYLIQKVFKINDPLIGLVTFQTGINVLFIVMFYPFIELFSGYLEKLYKGIDEDTVTKYIQKVTNQFPNVALKATEKETAFLVMSTIRFNRSIYGLNEKKTESDSWLLNIKNFAFENSSTDDDYKKLKQLQGEILEYLMDIPKNDMTPFEVETTGKLITISRNIIHAAKNIKDIQHNINELNTTANDTLHELYMKLREAEMIFYTNIQKLLLNFEQNISIQELEVLLQKSKEDYTIAVNNTLDLLNKDKIMELDSSTLLNVFREVHSSHNSLLSAIKDLIELNKNSE